MANQTKDKKKKKIIMWSIIGFFVLMAGLLFLLIRKMRKLKKQPAAQTEGGKTITNPKGKSLTEKLLNPMALTGDDAWRGKVDKHGIFVVFNNLELGIRAGMKNLRNGYFNRGVNTLYEIFKRYAPEGHGRNNPKSYAETVAGRMGVSPSQVLDWNTHGPSLSYQIHRVEAGYDWVSEAQFNNVFNKYGLGE